MNLASEQMPDFFSRLLEKAGMRGIDETLACVSIEAIRRQTVFTWELVLRLFLPLTQLITHQLHLIRKIW